MSRESFCLFRGQLMGSNKELALKALSIAEKAHEGQLRKDGTTPYIEHPMKVASFLYTLNIRDDEILAVALLHDVLEDSPECVLGLIGEGVFQGIPQEVLTAVHALTKPKEYDNDVYYEAIKANPYATVVKLADRAHNLSTLYNFTDEKKREYLEETKKYIIPLVNYAQHNYYEYRDALRLLEVWIESLYNNLTAVLNKKED